MCISSSIDELWKMVCDMEWSAPGMQASSPWSLSPLQCLWRCRCLIDSSVSYRFIRLVCAVFWWSTVNTLSRWFSEANAYAHTCLIHLTVLQQGSRSWWYGCVVLLSIISPYFDSHYGNVLRVAHGHKSRKGFSQFWKSWIFLLESGALTSGSWPGAIKPVNGNQPIRPH